MSRRALTVDLHGTLLHLSEPVLDVYLRTAGKHGLNREPSSTRTRLSRAMRTYRGPWTPDGRDMWRSVVFHALDTDRDAIFEELYAHYASAQAWTVDTDLVGVIVHCRRLGWSTAVLSNLDHRAHGLLSALELSALFDFVVLAHEAGHPKPDRPIFDLAASKLGGVRPLHIGDDVIDDVDGARAAGWEACLYRGTEHLEEVRQKVGMLTFD